MTFHNMLSICVLIAVLATGDCFFSNLMNEPLNFAVSLLDGQAQNKPHPTTARPIHTPGPITLTGNAATTFSAMPGGHSKYKDIVTKKLTTYIGGASKKNKLPIVEAIRYSPLSSSKQSSSISDESSSKLTWKHVRPAPERPSKKGYNQRIKASLSTGRRHSSHGRANKRPALSKASHKLRQSGWKKTSWAANRSSGSGEKYPVVTAKQANVGSSSSSEEHIVVVKKTAKPTNKLGGSSKKSGWKKTSWAAKRSSGSGEKYPVVTAKQAKGVGSSSSSEEHIVVVKKTAKPTNKLGGSSKKSGWKKTSWAANRSSGSGEKYPVVPAKQANVGSSSSEEHIVVVKKTAKPANKLRGTSRKYPVVTAKQAKGVGSSSSSSEENVILVKKTAKPTNKLGGSNKKSGWKKTSWAANRSSGSGEKYPVVTAKQAKRVGSSSSEEHIVVVKKTAKPAHSFRASRSRQSYRTHNNQAAGGFKPKRRSSPKHRGSGLCNLCRGSY